MMKPVDADTGEVLIQQTVYRHPGDVVTVFDPNKVTRNIKHVRVRTARQQKRVYATLTIEERGFLFSLLPYLEWETNIVVGDGEISEQGKPLNFRQIDKIANISKNFRVKLINSVVEKRLIGYLVVKNKKVAIVVNPDFAIRGRNPSETLKKAFRYAENIDDDDF